MPDPVARIVRPIGGGTSRSPRSLWLVVGALAVVLTGIIATVYLQGMRERDPSLALIEPTSVDPITDLPLTTAEAPLPLFDEAPFDEPQGDLPPLDESDAEFFSWLTELFGAQTALDLFVPERLIRNIVVSIDNLPREQLAREQRPLRPTPGTFVVEGEEDAPTIAPANYARYAPFMLFVRNTDPRVPAALYRRFRPLFQEAYEDLGYPSRSFQARLIEVIDHLLAAPEIEGPIALIQPRVVYQYADPRLERLSAGHKLLLRIGPENAAIVKAKLRELRAELLQY